MANDDYGDGFVDGFVRGLKVGVKVGYALGVGVGYRLGYVDGCVDMSSYLLSSDNTTRLLAKFAGIEAAREEVNRKVAVDRFIASLPRAGSKLSCGCYYGSCACGY